MVSKVHGANTGPPGPCRPQVGSVLAPSTLPSGVSTKWSFHCRYNHHDADYDSATGDSHQCTEFAYSTRAGPTDRAVSVDSIDVIAQRRHISVTASQISGSSTVSSACSD